MESYPRCFLRKQKKKIQETRKIDMRPEKQATLIPIASWLLCLLLGLLAHREQGDEQSDKG